MVPSGLQRASSLLMLVLNALRVRVTSISTLPSCGVPARAAAGPEPFAESPIHGMLCRRGGGPAGPVHRHGRLGRLACPTRKAVTGLDNSHDVHTRLHDCPMQSAVATRRLGVWDAGAAPCDGARGLSLPAALRQDSDCTPGATRSLASSGTVTTLQRVRATGPAQVN